MKRTNYRSIQWVLATLTLVGCSFSGLPPLPDAAEDATQGPSSDDAASQDGTVISPSDGAAPGHDAATPTDAIADGTVPRDAGQNYDADGPPSDGAYTLTDGGADADAEGPPSDGGRVLADSGADADAAARIDGGLSLCTIDGGSFNGGAAKLQRDPHFRDLLLFYEYFHGDNGAGLGASHQTGWTGLVAKLIQQVSEYESAGKSPLDWEYKAMPASAVEPESA